MKIYFTIIYVVGVLVIKNSVSGKSLIFNKYSSGPHFDVRKQDDSRENFDRDNMQSLINSYKRSADEMSFQPLRRTFYDSAIQKRSPYGLVYNQGKPIGILEPIPQSFEYSAFSPKETSFRNNLYKSQWFPVKRESDIDMDEMEKDQLESQTSALHSSNYANVLAKFKVNNKVKHRPYQDYLSNSQAKRATSQDIKRKEMEELKKRGAVDMGNLQAAKSKVQQNAFSDDSINKIDAVKVNEIEENLKDVMGDMGLVGKDKEVEASQGNDGSMKKREIYFEDEDLENGLNKIGLTKESHYDRNKKEDCPGKTKVAKSKGSKKFVVEKNIHKKGKKKVRKDDELNAKRSIKSNKKPAEKKMDVSSGDLKKKVANYQYEGEEFIRRKRQEKENEKVDDSEIMRGLETSGDLTVSGNKSPLVAVTSADDSELKKSQEKRDKEELEYEKRLERNIQAKIDSIKDDVKREISKIKTDNVVKDQQRKKRNVITNTLLDEETSVLDPRVNIDQKLEPHIRKRRDLDNDDEEQETKLKREAHDDVLKDTKTDVTTIKKIREVNSNLSENNVGVKGGSESIQKVKRSNDDVKDVKKNLNNDKNSQVDIANVSKREDKVAESDKEIASTEKRHSALVKRNINEENASKNIEKRSDAFIATDKVETDNRAEFGTDAPDSIVKRSDHLASLGDNKIDDILSEAANVVKRNEQLDDSSSNSVGSAPASKDMNIKEAVDNNVRDDREVNEITDLETGQTILKDIDFESDSEGREERQSTNNNEIDDSNVKTASADLTDLNSEQEEEMRDERSTNNNKVNKAHNVNKQEKSPATNHKSMRRNIEEIRLRRGLIKQSITDNARRSYDDLGADNKRAFFNVEDNQSPFSEELKDYNIKQRDTQNEINDEPDKVVLGQRSADNQQNEEDTLDDSINERSAVGKANATVIDTDAELDSSLERGTRKSSNKSATADLGFDAEDSFSDQMNDEVAQAAVDTRRKRRTVNQLHRNRRKRDETSYSENTPELLNYRADNDGEIDDEGDEMHDDGFDDQTSNFMSKRAADYDNDNYGTNEEQDNNDDYPMFVERNKRNALRLYDNENDAEESYNNFLYYPNRYSRKKRYNHENLAALHGGGMMKHAAARRERNMQPHEQSLRRKRLEKLNNRMHDQNENVAELSESDIFGGFPQSYEGELSRFKRVKRSNIK